MTASMPPDLDLLRTAAHRLTNSNGSLDPVIHLAGDASFVLLGEASHGTHEFYANRAQITKRLIAEKGFQAVAVEADWPDADRVNRFVRARQRYSCFDHFGEDEQAYGYAAGFDISQSCREEVVRQLKDLQQRAFEYLHRDGRVAEDEFFSAEQNARLVRDAEEYYRGMFQGRVNTWNLRDRHMAETLHALAAHLERRHGRAKIVVWAHNSHLGDARATDRAQYGEWTL